MTIGMNESEYRIDYDSNLIAIQRAKLLLIINTRVYVVSEP